MARWRGGEPAHIEPPEWYRNYHPEAWDEPDDEEIRMTAGCPDQMMEFLHDHHSRRRWHQAKYAYRQQNPLLAEQEFLEITSRRAKRLGGTL